MKPGAHAPARAGGFTFIEVMVALVIFSSAGLVLAAAFVNVLHAQQAALRRDEQAADLRLVRAALRAEPDPVRVQEWNDLPLPDGRDARWRAEIAATTVADLFDVTLTIEITGGQVADRPVITETCRLLRPTWSQPADREALRAASRAKLAERTYQ